MSIVDKIPQVLSTKEEQQIEQVLDMINRNRAIKSQYAMYRANGENQYNAFADLAEIHDLSERQIKRIVYQK